MPCQVERIPELIRRVSGKEGIALPLEGRSCEGPLHQHHWVTRQDGGPNTEDNLLTLCSQHHNMIHRIMRIYGRAEITSDEKTPAREH